MKTTLKTVMKIHDNSPLRRRTAYGILACTHSITIPMRDTTEYRCCSCGKVSERWTMASTKYGGAICGCGKSCFTFGKRHDEHDETTHEIHVGDEIDCVECDRDHAAVEAILAFAKTPEFSHLVIRDLTASRTGEWMSYIAYRRDSASPSGCIREVGVRATPYSTAALKGIACSVGPTRGPIAEGRR